jgi:hypothetical protein
VNADTAPRQENEDWDAFAKRSRTEFEQNFHAMVWTTDFDKEIDDWPPLKMMRERGEDVMSCRRFVLYPVSRATYDRLHSG